MNILRGHIFFAASVKFIVVLVLYQLSRVFFFLSNLNTFKEVELPTFLHYAWHGVRFDLATITHVNLPWIILQLIPFRFRTQPRYQKALHYWFIGSNSLMFLLETIDYAYFPFTLQRSTSSLFQFTNTEKNLFSLLQGFAIEYWHAPLALFILVFLLIVLTRKLQPTHDLRLATNRTWWAVNLAIFSCVLLLTIGGMRGGFSLVTRPLNNSNALKYVEEPMHVALVLNTPFSILRTIGQEEAERYAFFSETELNHLYPVELHPPDTLPANKKNVVIIILESFGKEYTGYYNQDRDDYTGFTPFLDSLMSVSENYTHAYANGKKSIDAIPSILAGIPSIGNNYILSHHSSNEINGLPGMLREWGYETSFYHGAATGSMAFDAFCKHAGMEHYYGKEDYEKVHPFTGNEWGVFDEEFFQFFADGIDQMKEPFFTTIFTLTSHGPYTLPERYEGKFNKGPLEVHEVIQYTDYALQQFFKRVQNEPWFDNTLFVLTADHTAIPYFQEYKNGHGQFMIPLIFYQKNSPTVGDVAVTAQQIDILPTVLSALHYPKPYFSLGRDLRDSTQVHFAFNHFGFNKNYQITMGDYLYSWNTDNHKKGLYNVKDDPLLRKNLIRLETERTARMDTMLRAAIQQYNNRLLDNRFTVK